MSTRRPIGHWLLLAALVAVWGSSFLFTKVALEVFAPEGLVATRLVLAALVLAPALVITGRRLPSGRRQWSYLLSIAIVGNALPFFLISWGQQRIDSGLAGILMAVMPLTTVLLAHVFVPGERLTRSKSLGFLFGFIGIVVLTGPEALLELEGQGTVLLSELAVLAGAICYAINTIITRHRPKCDSLSATVAVMLIASTVMLPLALRTSGLPAPSELTWTTGLSAAFLGLISTALANIIFFRLIAIAGPSFMSTVNYLIPLWAIALGFVVLGEVPKWTALAALVLILGGIALSER